MQRADVLHHNLPPEERRPETGSIEPAAAAALFGLGRGDEARLRASAAYDACLAARGPDHLRMVKIKALLDRIDGA
ncbi:hypothetical protein ACIRP0_33240 [Streptomyces sp. NPDC101733]|uniref:hypothetical protein n=1 Tax=unclassified Streptomyces TaxID=2593676 RepID=UPI0038204E91